MKALLARNSGPSCDSARSASSAEPPGIHYKDEAFERIVHAAIQVRSVKIANDAAKIWSKSGDNAESALVDAWLAAGRTDEAIDAVRRIEDPERRAMRALLLSAIADES